MNGDDRVDVGRVATAHRNRHGNVASVAGVEHEPVARAKSVDRQLQPAESIPLVRIGAGQIEDEVRTMAVEDARQM